MKDDPTFPLPLAMFLFFAFLFWDLDRGYKRLATIVSDLKENHLRQLEIFACPSHVLSDSQSVGSSGGTLCGRVQIG